MREIPIAKLLTALTPARLFNIGLVALSLGLAKLIRRPIAWGLPFVMTVEPTNRCQLACPQCDRGAGLLQRPTGDMRLSLFDDILRQTHRSVLYLLLYDQGEPLLHADYVEMVRNAKRHRMVVTCCSNGQELADADKAWELAASGLDNLILSVDGLTEATFQVYRQGGQLNRVIAAIGHIRQAREALRQKTPRICLQFIVMKHNEQEIVGLPVVARRWGADRVLLKSLQVRTAEDGDQWLPKNETFRRYAHRPGQLFVKNRADHLCSRLWYSCVVHQDGSVVGCCFDKDNHHVFGDLTIEPFSTIWQGGKTRTFRRAVAETPKPEICHNCTHGLAIYQ